MRERQSSDLGFTLLEMLAVMLVIGALTGIAVPRIRDAQEKAKVAKAIGDIRTMQVDLAALDSLPQTLAGIGRAAYADPWGNPYQYLLFPDHQKSGPPQGARRDRFLVPLNSEYDLYSMGADGESRAPLNAKASRDDVIRAMDGGFIGLAVKF